MGHNLKHLAIILDGNRRWAKKRGLPPFAGHREGIEAVKRVIQACLKYKIRYLTVYVFSTENWQRSKREVGYLMKLAHKYIGGGVDYFDKYDIRVKIWGRMADLDKKLAQSLQAVEQATKNNKSLCFNICLNYGGRLEILEAVKKIIRDKKSPAVISEELFSSYLFSAGVPDPDMIVRSSGEMRLSNFLTWQGVYSELYFTRTLWPDFGEKEIKGIIREFGKRQRRFGK